MAWFLVILFLSALAPGGVELREGWHPLPQADLQTCKESILRVMAYADSVELEIVAFCEPREANP